MAMASQTGEGLVIARAVDDALAATAHFRRVLGLEGPLRERPPVPPVKVNAIPEALAKAISADVAASLSIPEDLIDVAKQHLTPDDVRPFLLLVGHVAGCSISDVAETLWASYPDLAPPGWKTTDA